MTNDTFPPAGTGRSGDAADELDRLLIRYFSGQATAIDRRRLERWLGEAADRPRELERLRHLWQRSSVEPMQVPVEAALSRFKERVRQDEAAASIGRKFRTPLVASARRGASWLAAAAVLALAVGTGFWWREVSALAGGSVVAPANQLYATPRGQRDTVRLSDGTLVTLAPSSTLEVPAGFGNGMRDVHLTGLAFFAVAKDSVHPFRVHGGSGFVQVLGTEFSVRAGRGGEDAMAVVVAEGRVALRPAGVVDSTIPLDHVLAHGDLGHIRGNGHVEVIHGVDLAHYLGWVDGRLSFDQTPLPVVLRELEIWFGVNFVLESPALYQAQLTTTFDNDSLADALQLLEVALGAKAEVNGKTVRLTATR